jgi:hypothetical protein
MGPDTVYGPNNTQTRLASDTADNLSWDRYTLPTDSRSPALSAALSRIVFSNYGSAQPLHAVVELVSAEVSRRAATGQGVVAVVGRSRRMAVESHAAELRELNTERGSPVGSEVIKTVGEVGATLVAVDTSASLLIMQAHVHGV